MSPGSCQLTAGWSRVPRALAAGPWGSQGWYVSPLMGRAGAQGVLGMVPAHWWVELGPRVSGCRALAVPALVPAHCCVGLGPGPSGGQGHVPG